MSTHVRARRLTGRDGLHQLLSLLFVLDGEGEEVSGSSKLELGNSFGLLDGDLCSELRPSAYFWRWAGSSSLREQS